MLDKAQKAPLHVAHERRPLAGLASELEQRKVHLAPLLIWRDKVMQDWSDPGSEAGASLIVHAPPLYIQEKTTPRC